MSLERSCFPFMQSSCSSISEGCDGSLVIMPYRSSLAKVHTLGLTAEKKQYASQCLDFLLFNILIQFLSGNAEWNIVNCIINSYLSSELFWVFSVLMAELRGARPDVTVICWVSAKPVLKHKVWKVSNKGRGYAQLPVGAGNPWKLYFFVGTNFLDPSLCLPPLLEWLLFYDCLMICVTAISL